MFKFIKTKIFRNFLISYCVVFIIPLVLAFSIFYRVNIATLEKQIYTAKNTELKQQQMAYDDKIRRIHFVMQLLNGNHYLTKVLAVEDNHFNNDERLAAKYFIDSMIPYISANDFIDLIYIYSYKSDYVITTNNTRKYKNTYEEEHQVIGDELTYGQWENIMRGQYRVGELVVFSSLQKRMNESTPIYYIQSLPVFGAQEVDGTAVIKINTKFIEKMRGQAANDENEKFVLLDEDNTLLYTNNVQIPFDITFNLFTEKEGQFEKEGYFISYVKTELASAVFVSVRPKSVMLQEVTRTKVLFWLILIVCIVLGGGITYYFTVRNYNPIKQLIQMTKQYGSREINNKDNFTEINLALMEVIDEKVTYEAYYKQKQQVAWQNRLMQLLENKNKQAQKIVDILQEVKPKLLEHQFVLVGIVLTDFSEMFFEPVEGDHQVTKEKPLHIYQEIIEQMLENYQTLNVTNNDKLYFWVNGKEEDSIILKGLAKRIENAQKFMRDNYAIDSFVAISDVHLGVNEMYTAYNEVIQVNEYFNLVGDINLLMYTQMNQMSMIQNLQKRHMVEERALVSNICHGDFDKSKMLLDNIFNNDFFGEIKSPQVVKLRMFGLLNSVINGILESEIPDINRFVEQLHPFTRLLKCNNIKALYLELINLLQEIHQYMNEEKDSSRYELKQKIVDIVNSNYANPNINVSYIAYETGNTLEYISRYFKKTTHIGLLDYIHHKRISEAKKILKTKEISVYEVAKQVGYTNVDSFIRVFKKIEGMTPGQYRSGKKRV